jgi:hypothetical protein
MIGDPFAAGAVNATVNCPIPPVTVVIMGFSGALNTGINGLARDNSEYPAGVMAAMRRVYRVSLVNLVIVMGEDAPLTSYIVDPDASNVYAYPVTGAPLAGWIVNETTALVFPVTTVVIVGGKGGR